MTAPIIWLTLGIIMLVFETFMPGFVILFFGLGALVVSLVCALYNNVSLNMQLLIFIVSSIALLGLLRKTCKNVFTGLFASKNKMPENINSNIGEKALVIEKIIPARNGKIEFHGTTWDAIADETILENTVVTIVKQDNLTFKVK